MQARKKLRMIGTVLLTVFLCIGLLGGCKSREKEAFQVVCTVYPVYDWLCSLLDGVQGVEVTLLNDTGADMHSYQASADDMIAIQESDLFVCIGGESEQWVLDALSDEEDREEKILLPMLKEWRGEDELSDEEEDEHEEHDHEHEEASMDEHVWLSLRNADFFVGELSETLQKLLPEEKEKIAENASLYKEKLSELDQKYETLCKTAPIDTLIIGDRFPFRYLVQDYDLHCYAAFSGCSAESEASFETVIFLAKKIEELGIDTILVLDGSDKKIAQTIAENTSGGGQSIVTFNSLQSVTPQDGVDYLSAMEENYKVLARALGAE